VKFRILPAGPNDPRSDTPPRTGLAAETVDLAWDRDRLGVGGDAESSIGSALGDSAYVFDYAQGEAAEAARLPRLSQRGADGGAAAWGDGSSAGDSSVEVHAS
jgi:hypothetical protein